MTGPGTSPYIWDLATNTPRWLPNNSAINVDKRDQGASVLLPPAQDQKVMVIGGSGTATTAIIDLKAANPAYTAGPPIEEGKQYVSAVILPDGRVLETGGTERGPRGPERRVPPLDPDLRPEDEHVGEGRRPGDRAAPTTPARCCSPTGACSRSAATR